MRTLYIECNMGAAGDTLMSALLELYPNPEAFIEKLNGLNIPHVRFERTTEKKCGITGTHIKVMVDGKEENENMHHHHKYHHSTLNDIEHIFYT